MFIQKSKLNFENEKIVNFDYKQNEFLGEFFLETDQDNTILLRAGIVGLEGKLILVSQKESFEPTEETPLKSIFIDKRFKGRSAKKVSVKVVFDYGEGKKVYEFLFDNLEQKEEQNLFTGIIDTRRKTLSFNEKLKITRKVEKGKNPSRQSRRQLTQWMMAISAITEMSNPGISYHGMLKSVFPTITPESTGKGKNKRKNPWD
jgi:hypothetical protein